MRHTLVEASLIGLALMVMAVGCGKDDTPLEPVQGEKLLTWFRVVTTGVVSSPGGKPLVGGSVIGRIAPLSCSNTPTAGQGVATDTKGRYQIDYLDLKLPYDSACVLLDVRLPGSSTVAVSRPGTMVYAHKPIVVTDNANYTYYDTLRADIVVP